MTTWRRFLIAVVAPLVALPFLTLLASGARGRRSGIGAYGALVGHACSLHFVVTPASVFPGFPGEILPLPTTNGLIVAPAAVVGTLTVSP
jgi:NO-binding membrane sensor protein with MHYT domain